VIESLEEGVEGAARARRGRVKRASEEKNRIVG